MASPTSSIGGLSSGLDTNTIVSQLMQIESASQTRLKNRLADDKADLAVMQNLNSRIAGLATAAKDFTGTTGSKVWTARAVSSSNDGLTATAAATGTAAAGITTVHVDNVAVAHSLRFNSTAALTDVVAGTGAITITNGDGPTTLSVGTGTLDEVMSAINAADLGLKASTVKLDDGTLRLTVRSETTGDDSAFTLTDDAGNPILGDAVVTTGRDAAVTIDGDQVHSSTNSFSGVLTGLDLTISASAVGQDVDVTVGEDPSKAKAAVSGLVSSVNFAVDELARLTASGGGDTTKGALAGNSAARDLRTALSSAVFPTDGTSMASIGLQLDRSGKLTFDETKFAAAMDADPEATQAAFNAFAQRIQTASETASDSVDGYLTTSITSSQAGIKRTESDIDAWTLRLDQREATLRATFTALETALSKMSAQSSWLSQQISAMSSSS